MHAIKSYYKSKLTHYFKLYTVKSEFFFYFVYTKIQLFIFHQCNRWDDPPYRTGAAYGNRLSDKTLCLIGEQTNGVKKFKHYDVHNLYGYTETIATYEAMLRTRPGKRPLVITRSTFPGSGVYAGHWLGDNESSWPHLKFNIVGLLEFNLFGVPYVGADTVGFA